MQKAPIWPNIKAIHLRIKKIKWFNQKVNQTADTDANARPDITILKDVFFPLKKPSKNIGKKNIVSERANSNLHVGIDYSSDQGT